MTPEESQEEFQERISRCLTLIADEWLLARRLGTSRPTVLRWAAGQSCPHELGMASVIAIIDKLERWHALSVRLNRPDLMEDWAWERMLETERRNAAGNFSLPDCDDELDEGAMLIGGHAVGDE